VVAVAIAINGNEITGDMSPVCEGPADGLDSVFVDEGVICDCDCDFCAATDNSCNPIKDLAKGYTDVDREVYSEAEDIVFEVNP
jgi:hypothetical protein